MTRGFRFRARCWVAVGSGRRSWAQVFTSASADGTVAVWDTRKKNGSMLSLRAHEADVNVISWNRNVTYLLASGSDDGSFKIWDLRAFRSGEPVAQFRWHKVRHLARLVAGKKHSGQVRISIRPSYHPRNLRYSDLAAAHMLSAVTRHATRCPLSYDTAFTCTHLRPQRH